MGQWAKGKGFFYCFFVGGLYSWYCYYNAINKVNKFLMLKFELPPRQSIAWFVVAMAISMVVYGITRLSPWDSTSPCSTLGQELKLDAEEFVLNRQISHCKSSLNQEYYEHAEHYTRRLSDCQKLDA